jgi:hypothetical protein
MRLSREPPASTEDGLKLPQVSIHPKWACDCSLLTIFCASNAASWRNEDKAQGDLGGSLSHVWREAGRKVRAQYRSATYEPPSRPALNSHGKVVVHRMDWPA